MEDVILWQSPVDLQKPEFRLYYDERGSVLFYTCEKVEGNYIVIDAKTFAEGRPDVKVINGKISQVNPNSIVSKLEESDQGITCASDDVSIIVDETYNGKTIKWKLRTYELQ
jgi:hypothetical protein